jgi:hypothetical protein
MISFNIYGNGNAQLMKNVYYDITLPGYDI